MTQYVLKLKRNTSSTDITNYTPVEAEPIYDVQRGELRIGDGQTPGGKLLFSTIDQSMALSWSLKSIQGQKTYTVPQNQIHLRDQNRGVYMIFYSGTKLAQNDYSINLNTNSINFNFDVTESDLEIFILFIHNKSTSDGLIQYSCNSSTSLQEYTPLYNKVLRNPDDGIYIVFYGAIKLVSEDFSINFSENKLILNFIPEENDIPIDILFFSNN